MLISSRKNVGLTINALAMGLLVLVIALAPTLADARPGSGSSSGSRGGRSFEPPAATNTAPRTAQPLSRTAATPQQQTRPYEAAASQSQRPSLLGGLGGGFASGLLGGLIGAGIGGLLFGNGFFGGGGLGGGMSGFLGLLLQAALIGGAIWLAFSFFRRRSQPAHAAAHGSAMNFGGGGGGHQVGGHGTGGMLGGHGGSGHGQRGNHAGHAQAGQSAASYGPPPVIGPSDYESFETLLKQIQDAYGRNDLSALGRLATEEMAAYFADDLQANRVRGVENRVEQVRLLQGDLSEAWSEPNQEYATVAMRFSLIDYTIEKTSGRVVEGDKLRPTEVTEVWTFVRPRSSGNGNPWRLSAIQQTGG